jgi:hypothetical protein
MMNKILNLPPPVDITPLYQSLPQKSFKVSASTNVTIPSSLTSVTITETTLDHVLHMGSTTGKYENIKHKALGGFHVLTDDIHNRNKVCRFCVEAVGPHVFQGFILQTNEHLPVYKTFFSELTPEETIQCFQESLLNISRVEDQGKVWLIEGTSLTPAIRITSIVTKDKLELKTFYPTSHLSKTEIKEYEQEKNIYVRYYFNPCPGLDKTVADQMDSSALQSYFGTDGLNVQLKFVHLDTRSIDSYMFSLNMNNFNLQPDMSYGLLPSTVLDTISHDLDDFRQKCQNDCEKIMCYLNNPKTKISSARRQQLTDNFFLLNRASFIPSRKIEVLETVDKIYLPIETIDKVFFDGMKRFPDHLTMIQILDKLKEAIENYVQLMKEDFEDSIWEDIDLTTVSQTTTEQIDKDPLSPSWLPIDRDSKTTGTEWDYFGGPVFPPKDVSIAPASNKYALEMMHYDLCGKGNFSWGGNQDVPYCLPVPNIGFHNPNQKIASLQLYSSGTCFMDTWKFIIHLDPFTGIISEFGILLGNHFTLNAMKPTFKMMTF